jgi:hypothetical protein
LQAAEACRSPSSRSRSALTVLLRRRRAAKAQAGDRPGGGDRPVGGRVPGRGRRRRVPAPAEPAVPPGRVARATSASKAGIGEAHAGAPGGGRVTQRRVGPANRTAGLAAASCPRRRPRRRPGLPGPGSRRRLSSPGRRNPDRRRSGLPHSSSIALNPPSVPTGLPRGGRGVLAHRRALRNRAPNALSIRPLDRAHCEVTPAARRAHAPKGGRSGVVTARLRRAPERCVRSDAWEWPGPPAGAASRAARRRPRRSGQELYPSIAPFRGMRRPHRDAGGGRTTVDERTDE